MKTKRKFFPANTADIPALESWLEDLALEGLFPLSFNGYYAKFRQSKPQKMTFRIEIPKYFQGMPPKTMRETYEAFGWQFVCAMWQKYYLFACTEESPMEPHTDPLAQGELFQEAYQDSKRAFLSGVGVGLVFLLIFILIAWSQFALFISTFSAFEFCIILFVLLLSAGLTVLEFRTCSRLRHQLASGIPLEHRKSYRKPLLLQLLLVPLCVLVSFLPSLSILTDGLKQLPELSAYEISSPLPYLSLAEIEDVGEAGKTYITFKSSLFAPVQYRVREYHENSSLEITYMEVRPKLFAAQVMKTLTGNGHYSTNNISDPQEIELEPHLFDGIEYSHSGDKTIFAARKDDTVLLAVYHGEADLSVCLPAFSALMEQHYAPPARK